MKIMKKMKIKISQGFLLANGLIALSIAFIMLYLGLFLVFGLLSILSFINLFVFLKRRDETQTFALIIAIYFIFLIPSYYYSIGRKIYFKGGYITPAIVIKKTHTATHYYSESLSYEFWEGNKLHKNIYLMITVTDFERIQVGDTILAIYVKGNYSCTQIYKLYPTKKAIKKYREGVYYKKRGKIYKE
jgi:hypothetical protein